MRRAVAILAAVVAGVTLSAAGCEPAKPPPATPEPTYPAVPPPRSGPDNPLDRHAIAPVPAGLPIGALDFTDADEGYALFQRCSDNGGGCRAGLAVTLDGGGSWLARPLPFDPAHDNEIRMYVGRGGLLMLAVNSGWYLSRDTGRTFEHRVDPAEPSELNLAGPRFLTRCPATAVGGTCPLPRRVLEIGPDGKETPLPVAPQVGELVSAELGGDGRLWAAGVRWVGSDRKSGDLLVAVSTDRGRSWKPAGTIRFDGSAGIDPMLAVSDDGSDVWVAGANLGDRLQPDGRWAPVPAMADIDDVRSAIALGGGILLLAGIRGASTVTGTAWTPDAPPEVFKLRDLGDGVIIGYVRNPEPGTVWLCLLQGTQREWIRVAVAAPGH